MGYLREEINLRSVQVDGEIRRLTRCIEEFQVEHHPPRNIIGLKKNVIHVIRHMIIPSLQISRELQ
jgi:hypothetical protein